MAAHSLGGDLLIVAGSSAGCQFQMVQAAAAKEAPPRPDGTTLHGRSTPTSLAHSYGQVMHADVQLWQQLPLAVQVQYSPSRLLLCGA